MVKKNLVNKNVVRALSIGLSLAMASQPLTAMAAEPADDAPVREPISEAPAVETQSEAEVAEAKAAEVKEDVDTDTANVNDVVDLTKDAISKAEALDVDASAANTDVQTLESGKKAAGVQEELQKITSETTGETTLKGLAQGVATAEANVTKPVEDAEKAVFGDKEEEVESLSEKIENADTAIKDASGKIAGATTPGAANSAYNEAATAVNDADTAVKAAEEKVETAQKELEVKEDEYNSRAELYEAALKAYNEKVDALNQAKADALAKLTGTDTEAGLSAQLAELFAEDEQEVAVDKASLEVLKKALDDAELNYKKSGYGYIAALENAIIEKQNKTAEYGTGVGELSDADITAVEDENNNTKATYRNLFKAIVQTYYVPEVLKGEFVSIVAEDCGSGDYYYGGDETDANNKSSKGDVLRVFTVTYKELDENGHVKKDENGNDVEKTIRLNYKTANENKKNGYQGIVIFEKTEHILIDGKESGLTSEQLASLAEEGSELTLADGTVIRRVDGQLVKFSGTGALKDDESYVESTTAPIVNGNVKTEVVAEAVADADVTWTFKDGTLVKTVTQDVTTTTYIGQTLAKQENTISGTSATDDSAAKTAYRNALKEKIKALEKDEELIIGEVSFNLADFNAGKYTDDQLLTGYVGTSTSKEEADGTYTVSGTYNKVSKTDKYISGSIERGWDHWTKVSYDETEKKYWSKVNDIVDDYTFDDHVFFVDGDGYQTDYALIDKKADNPTINGNSDKRNYSGTLHLTYYDLTSETVDAGFFMIFTYGSVDDDDIREALAKQGKYYLGKTEFGNGWGNYQIHYVDATSVTKTVTAANEDAAKTAFEGSFTDNEHARVTSAVANTTTKYYFGYNELSYTVKKVVNSTNSVTYTWSSTDADNSVLAAAATTTSEFRNDNWYSGNVVSTKVDKDNNFVAGYRTDGKGQGGNKIATVLPDVQSKSTSLIANINAAKTKINEYETAKAAVATAEQKVKAAEGEVETLKGLIEQISFSKKDNILAGLRSRLETAETELATAKAARDQLLEDLRTLDGQRAKKVAALTSAPSGEGGGETGGEGGATTPGATGLLPGAEAPLAAAPAMFVAAPGGAGAPAAAAVAEDNTVTLTEQRAALSDAVPEAQTEQSTENIDDGKTALAAAPVSEETLSWWWLLIIAVLGGAGYAMYRKFHNKKDEKTTN